MTRLLFEISVAVNILLALYQFRQVRRLRSATAALLNVVKLIAGELPK